MSNFNEKLVTIIYRGAEDKGSIEVKTVVLFKEDQEVIFENNIHNYRKPMKAGNLLEGYGIHMDNDIIHVDDSLSNYLYDNIEEAQEYIPALLNN